MAVVDIELPHMSGLDLARIILSDHHLLRAIIINTYVNPAYVLEAIAIGTHGYLCKSEPTAAIAAAIMTVSQGNYVFSDEVAHIAASIGHTVAGISLPEKEVLSDRERAVALMMARGEGFSACAKKLNIHESTARSFWRRALAKMSLKTLLFGVNYFFRSATTIFAGCRSLVNDPPRRPRGDFESVQRSLTAVWSMARSRHRGAAQGRLLKKKDEEVSSRRRTCGQCGEPGAQRKVVKGARGKARSGFPRRRWGGCGKA